MKESDSFVENSGNKGQIINQHCHSPTVIEASFPADGNGSEQTERERETEREGGG